MQKSQLRDLIARALYPTKAYRLPAACERYGLSPGTHDEAMSSKTRYIMTRLDQVSDQRVVEIALGVPFGEARAIALIELPPLAE